MRLLARYDTVEELATDVGDQLPRGGMVVRTTVPAGLQLFSSVEVAVECGGSAIVVAGQVLQIFPGIGVAVGLDRGARDRIEGLAGGTRAGLAPVEVPGAEPGVDAGAAGAAAGLLDEPFPEPPPPAARRDTSDIDLELSARLARGTSKPTDDPPVLPRTTTMPGLEDPPEPRRQVAAGSSPSRPLPGGSATSVDRIQLALRGDRDQRLEIMRGRNHVLHVYVLRNPGLTVDEVAYIARMPSVSPDALTQIAERREWGRRPDVAIALVRNPATPVTVAIRMVELVSVSDLRVLVKDGRTREPVLRAARKKLLS